MNKLSMDDIRNDVVQMLRSVERGESVVITSNARPIARVTPMGSPDGVIPAKRTDRPRLSKLPQHEVRSADSIDALLVEMREDRIGRTPSR